MFHIVKGIAVDTECLLFTAEEMKVLGDPVSLHSY